MKKEEIEYLIMQELFLQNLTHSLRVPFDQLQKDAEYFLSNLVRDGIVILEEKENES